MPGRHRSHRRRHRAAVLAAALLARPPERRGDRRPRVAGGHLAVLRRLRRDLGAAVPAVGGRRPADTRPRRRHRPAARTQPRLAGVGAEQRLRLVPDGRHAHPAAGPGARAHPRPRGPARRADRGQPRPPEPRADVGRAGHDAGCVLPARTKRRCPLGRAVPAQRAAPVVAARMVGAPRLRVLDAGPLRPPQHLPRRRARLRGHGQRADPRPASARCGGVVGVAGVHRQHRAAQRDARGRSGELARLPRRARRLEPPAC